MDLLLFSYQCLPSHLQRCFAYCSLFPKGYKFYFDVRQWQPHLISLWIAQGFIENTSELTLEEVGRKYIEELLAYSFFEKNSTYSFIIHDLLHDLTEKVSKKQCHPIEHYDSLHVPTTCIHLSLIITEEWVRVALSNMVPIYDIFKLRNLRSLIILWHAVSPNIFKKDTLRSLTKLRALYVESYQQMEVLRNPCIDKLKHLRYLHVRHDSKLPLSLAKLYQLQFFILLVYQEDIYFYLPANILPQGFSNLINLRTLKFYGEDGFELDYLYYNSKMINIEKLTSLHSLKNFHPDGFNGMVSLKNLPLCGSLSILNLENVNCKEEAKEAMLTQKKNLNELRFSWCCASSSIDTCEGVLEGLEPHRNLEKLAIICYQGVRFPNWMVKENRLPRLQTLTLRSCTSLKIVPCLPPRLQELDVCDCDELMQLPPLSDTLHNLILSNCPKLPPPSMFNKSPGLSDLSFLTNLKILELRGFPNLQVLTNVSPSVTDFILVDCPMLTSLENLQCCTSMKHLEIRKCPMLMREEASLVEGIVEGDIVNRLPLVESFDTDEPLLVFELVRQQAFSSINKIILHGPFHMSDDEYFHHFSSLTRLYLRLLTSLPNLEKIPSLVYLQISECPDVESLPNLPASLRILHVYGCPKLKEKYEVGGPLRNTISHIPDINIH